MHPAKENPRRYKNISKVYPRYGILEADHKKGVASMLLPAMGEVPYEARRMYLCVDAYHSGEWEGRFYSAFEPDAFHFRSVLALLRHVDDLLDRTMLTQRHEERRSFLQMPAQQATVTAREDWRKFRCLPGKQATFSLSIQFRQNATWQGEVVWVEQKQSSFFRSGMELFRMMDDVLLYQESKTRAAGEKTAP